MVTSKQFGLETRPLAAQLTIHINNLLLTYPENKKDILKYMKFILNNTNKKSYSGNINWAIVNRCEALVSFYGESFCKKWFTDIYGWKFNKVA